jgi:hypothetical protein
MIKKADIPAVIILILSTSSVAWGRMLVVGDGTTFTDPGHEVSIDINTTFWIGIHDFVGEMFQASIGISDFEEVEWTGNSAVYSPPAISTTPGWTHIHIDRWAVDLSDPDSTETPLPGVVCALEFRALSEGNFDVFLNNYPPPYWIGPILSVNIVPEPATFLLLALGSLLLTRHRG